MNSKRCILTISGSKSISFPVPLLPFSNRMAAGSCGIIQTRNHKTLIPVEKLPMREAVELVGTSLKDHRAKLCGARVLKALIFCAKQ